MSGQVIARVSAAGSGPAKLLLSAMDGRIIYRQQTAVIKGSQDITISGKRITPGVYVLTLMQNGNTISRQFVK